MCKPRRRIPGGGAGVKRAQRVAHERGRRQAAQDLRRPTDDIHAPRGGLLPHRKRWHVAPGPVTLKPANGFRRKTLRCISRRVIGLVFSLLLVALASCAIATGPADAEADPCDDVRWDVVTRLLIFHHKWFAAPLPSGPQPYYLFN